MRSYLKCQICLFFPFSKRYVSEVEPKKKAERTVIDERAVLRELQRVKEANGCPQWLDEAIHELLEMPDDDIRFKKAAQVSAWLHAEADRAPSENLTWEASKAYLRLLTTINPYRARNAANRRKAANTELLTFIVAATGGIVTVVLGRGNRPMNGGFELLAFFVSLAYWRILVMFLRIAARLQQAYGTRR